VRTARCRPRSISRRQLHRTHGRRRALGIDNVLRCSHGIGRHPHVGARVPGDLDDVAALRGPYILKPRFGGSSIGLTSWPISRPRQLDSDQPAFRTGLRRRAVRSDLADIQIAVRTYPRSPSRRSNGPSDVPISRNLDYRDKYVGGEDGVGATSVARGHARSPSRRGA